MVAGNGQLNVQNHILYFIGYCWLAGFCGNITKTLYTFSYKLCFKYRLVKQKCFFRIAREIKVSAHPCGVAGFILMAQFKLCLNVLVEVFKRHCKALFKTK